jgi:HEAT repeat protein
MRKPAVVCTSLAMILMFALPGIAQDEKPDLIRSLTDNQETRAGAARQLAKMGPAAKPAVPYLIKALKDLDLDVRVEVIHALGSIGLDAKDAIPDLLQILKEEDNLFELLRHNERQLIACSTFQLAQVRFSAIPLQVVFPDVIQWAKDDKARLIRASFFALMEIGPSAVPFLVKQISGEKVDANVCKLAMSLLGEFGCQSVSAVPALIKLLDHDDPYIRHNSADALAWILAVPDNGRKNQRTMEGKKIQRTAEFEGVKQMAVAALIKTLNDPEAHVRWAAGSALSMQRATAAIPALVDRMEKEEGMSAEHFADCLGRIVPEALPAVLSAIADESKLARVRLRAFHSFHVMSIPYTDRVPLDKDSAKKAVLIFKKVLQDRNEDLRSDAALALEEIGADARQAVPDLTEALKDPSVHVRIWAARAIYAIDGNNLSGLPVLIELLDDKSERKSAIHAIKVFGEKAVPKLIEALYDSNGFVRRPAVWALGEIRLAAKDAIPHLEQAIRDLDSMNAARRVAISALREIAKDAIHDEQVRRDIERSLERIRGLR